MPPPPPNTIIHHTPPVFFRLGVHTPAPTVAFTFGGEGAGPFWFRCKIDSRPGYVRRPGPRPGRGGPARLPGSRLGPGGGATTTPVYHFNVIRAQPRHVHVRNKHTRHKPTKK